MIFTAIGAEFLSSSDLREEPSPHFKGLFIAGREPEVTSAVCMEAVNREKVGSGYSQIIKSTDPRPQAYLLHLLRVSTTFWESTDSWGPSVTDQGIGGHFTLKPLQFHWCRWEDGYIGI